MGQNYLRSLFALGFQAFLIIVCVAIYAVLVRSIATDGECGVRHLDLHWLHGAPVLHAFQIRQRRQGNLRGALARCCKLAVEFYNDVHYTS